MATLKYADFKGAAKQLEDPDLPRIAHEIGCGEDEIHMLMEVESSGDGFDKNGRPKMLFEPHIFYAELGPGKDRDVAVKAGLAYKDWKPGKYPADSYPRLDNAMKINSTAALKSASWGASQILGRNFEMAGYDSVEDMVNGFCDDEDDHIEAMINFVKSAGIDDDLRRIAALKRPTTPDDCRPIALAYNGKSYATHGYHTKLAAAHNKWKKIPDTIWTPDSATGPIIVAQGDSVALSEVFVRQVQQALKDKGYVEVGRVDGVAGKDTAAAVTAFQIVEGLPVDGKVTEALFEKLKVAKMRPVSEARANATTADVVKNAATPVAESVQSVNLMGNIMKGVLAVSGVGALADGGIPDLDKLAATVNKTQLILSTIGDKLPWIIGFGAAGFALYIGSGTVSKIVAGYQKGSVK